MKDVNKVIEKNGSRVRVVTVNDEPTRTQQQFKDECDVNNIMRKYMQTGEITHLARRQGVYVDLSDIGDYQSMLDQVEEAQSAFLTLPAEVRARFGNDPGQLLSFIQDPKNYDEGVTLGLFEHKQEPQSETKNEIKNETKTDKAQ